MITEVFEFKKSKSLGNYDAIKYASRALPNSCKYGISNSRAEAFDHVFVKHDVVYGTNAQFVLHANVQDVPDGAYKVFFKGKTVHIIKTFNEIAFPPFEKFVPSVSKNANGIKWRFSHSSSSGSFYVELFRLLHKKKVTNLSVNPLFVTLSTDHGEPVIISIDDHESAENIVHIIECTGTLNRSAIIMPIIVNPDTAN